MYERPNNQQNDFINPYAQTNMNKNNFVGSNYGANYGNDYNDSYNNRNPGLDYPPSNVRTPRVQLDNLARNF